MGTGFFGKKPKDPPRAGAAEEGLHPRELGTVGALLFAKVSGWCWCAKSMLLCLSGAHQPACNWEQVSLQVQELQLGNLD